MLKNLNEMSKIKKERGKSLLNFMFIIGIKMVILNSSVKNYIHFLFIQ